MLEVKIKYKVTMSIPRPERNYAELRTNCFYTFFGAYIWRKYMERKGWKYHFTSYIVKQLTSIDYDLLEDLQLDGIDMRDYPDFCDAYICDGTYKGRALTDRELEVLNEDRDFVYQLTLERLY